MEPATWIYLALLAASTAASAQAQHKTNKARTKVATEERNRRKEQQKQSEEAAIRTQNEYLNQRNKAAEREAELADAFAPQQTPAPTTDAAGTRFLDTAAPTQSTRTIEGTQGEIAKGRARAAQRATSMAQLGAFGESMQNAGLAASRNAQDIGISSNAIQGWQKNVMPALYAKANMAGKDWSTASDIMKLAAVVMAPYALGGTAAQTGEVSAEQIAAARFGDTAGAFGAGGTVPFGSSFGIDAGAALTSAGGVSSGLAGSEALSKAMWKQINGYPLSDREHYLLLQRQMAGGM